MSTIPSLQELCLNKTLEKGLISLLDEEMFQVQMIAEKIIAQINPALLLEEKVDLLSEYRTISQNAGEAVKTNPSLANRALSWISLQPSFDDLKNRAFWSLKTQNSHFDWELEMSRIRDFSQLFDFLIRHSPPQIQIKNGSILQAEDLCLLFIARHNYWAGIAYVVEQGANLSMKFCCGPDNPSKNLLHTSIHQNGFNLMTMALIHSGIDINLEDYNGRSPLELLASKVPLLARPGYDLKSALNFLIKKGADLISYGRKALNQVKINHVPCFRGGLAEKEESRRQVIEMLEEAIEFRSALHDSRIV